MQFVQPREQHRMHGDGAPMRRQARRHFQFDRLQGLAGRRRGEVVEHAVHPRQQLSAFFQGEHQIVETGRIAIFRDGRDLGTVLRQRAVIGGGEMRRLDAVERGRPERRGPVVEKRIRHTANIGPVSGFPRPG